MNLEQLKAIVWLRWRLTRNQWRRAGRVNAVITAVIACIGLGLAAVGGIAGIVAGIHLRRASPLAILVAWDIPAAVFLFLWAAGVVQEVQRSETIDLSRLLHLPVALRAAFFLNYAASHASLSLAMTVPAMLGLGLGLTISRGPAMLLVLPAVAGFFFMVTAWTYYLRGWLGALMVNQRRRRVVVMAVTVTFVLIAQLPNLVMNVWLRGKQHQPVRGTEARTGGRAQGVQRADRLAMLQTVHQVVPFLWLPYGAEALAEGRRTPVLLGAGAMLLIGAVGLQRAYRSTIRFYQGGAWGKAVRRGLQPAAAPQRPLSAARIAMIERRVPLVPEEVSAMAMAQLRSMTRAPEVKMALVLNVVIFLVVGAGIFVQHGQAVPPQVRGFMPAAAAVVTFLGVIQIQFNQFGFDRDGFRALVLLPVERRHLVLGKNLSLLPIAGTVFFILLILLAILARLPPLLLVEGILLFAAGFLAMCVVGNLASILFPFRMAAGTLKPTKTRASTALIMILVAMFIPAGLAPLFAPAAVGLLCEHFGVSRAPFITGLLSLVLAVGALALYWLTLPALGRLFQRREQEILRIVTEEVE